MGNTIVVDDTGYDDIVSGIVTMPSLSPSNELTVPPTNRHAAHTASRTGHIAGATFPQAGLIGF